MTLRDALAAALTPFDVIRYNVDIHGEYADNKQVADAILSDTAFRAALMASIAEAFAKEHGWEEGYRITVGGAPEALDSMAAAIVARMLGEAT